MGEPRPARAGPAVPGASETSLFGDEIAALRGFGGLWRRRSDLQSHGGIALSQGSCPTK